MLRAWDRPFLCASRSWLRGKVRLQGAQEYACAAVLQVSTHERHRGPFNFKPICLSENSREGRVLEHDVHVCVPGWVPRSTLVLWIVAMHVMQVGFPSMRASENVRRVQDVHVRFVGRRPLSTVVLCSSVMHLMQVGLSPIWVPKIAGRVPLGRPMFTQRQQEMLG